MAKDKCEKCGNYGAITGHHVFPVRFFGRKNNHTRVMLCQKCHTAIEGIIPRYTKLERGEYIKITENWLKL